MFGFCLYEDVIPYVVRWSPDISEKTFMVVIATVFHLFPSRTEKLSPVAPMVLRCNAGE